MAETVAIGWSMRVLRAVESLIVRCGCATSWLNLGIIVAVLAAIIASTAGANELLSWEGEIPLFGEHLTINGVFDLEWHLFTVTVMFGGAHALLEDRHVRSDFLYQKMSPRGRRIVDIAGDVVFLMPFCVIIIWLSLGFAARAHALGEGSDYGGLVDRYLIKSMIPIGFGLLFIAAAVRVAGNIMALARRE